MVRASEYTFDAPDQVEAGLVPVTLLNAGTEVHLAVFGRMQDGTTFSDVQAAIAQNRDPSSLLDHIGGPGPILPGNRQHVSLNVPAGQVVLLCSILAADGQPHYAKGQIRTIDVSPPTQPTAVQPPSDGTISLRDFAFLLPPEERGVKQFLKVVNDGQDPHEIVITKAATGRTAQDVVNYFTAGAVGPAPTESLGGLSRLDRGQTAYMTLELPPGTYVLACRIRNESTGKIHSQLGMVRQLHLN